MVLSDSLKRLENAKVQFLQNWFQPQGGVMRRDQWPQEDGEHCREKTETSSRVYSDSTLATVAPLPWRLT